MLTRYADGATPTIHGQITAIDPRITGQDNPWAVLTITGQDGTATVDVPPREYLRFEGLLQDGAAVTVTGPVSRYRGQPVMRATNIQAVDTNEIVASLIEDSGNPGALGRMQELMATLAPDRQAEIWGRLTDDAPNPTGER